MVPWQLAELLDYAEVVLKHRAAHEAHDFLRWDVNLDKCPSKRCLGDTCGCQVATCFILRNLRAGKGEASSFLFPVSVWMGSIVFWLQHHFTWGVLYIFVHHVWVKQNMNTCRADMVLHHCMPFKVGAPAAFAASCCFTPSFDWVGPCVGLVPLQPAPFMVNS